MTGSTSSSHARYYRRSATRTLPFLPWGAVLALLLVAVFIYGLTWFASVQIEDEVAEHVERELARAGMSDVSVEVSGQNVHLRGEGTAQREERARAIAAAATGRTWAGALDSTIDITSEFSSPAPASGPDPSSVPEPATPEPVWRDISLSLEDGVFLLRGEVDGQKTRDSLLGVARQAVSPPHITSVRDEFTVAEQSVGAAGTAATADPAGTASAALATRGIRALALCTRGVSSVTGGVFSLRCSAPEKDIARVREIAGAPLVPAGDSDPGVLGTIEVLAVEQVQACEQSLADLLKNRSIEFASGSAALRPTSAPLLARIAEVARDCPGVLRIEGHTDDTGTPAGNMELSRARAEAVRGDLVGRGLDGSRLIAEGFGFTRPRVQGTSPAARSRNRRIEFRVVFRDSETEKGQP